MHLSKYIVFLGLWAAACSSNQFSAYQVEGFGEVPITSSTSKIVSLKNPDSKAVQHLLNVGFAGGGNQGGHFRVEKVMVGSRVVPTSDIKVPPGSSVNVQITYQPRDLNTTQASYGGLATGQPAREGMPKLPDEAKPERKEWKAMHRALFMAVYDAPRPGIIEVELQGFAVSGPDGEISLPEAGTAGCKVGEDLACLEGNFVIDIPKLFTTGPMTIPLIAPLPFHITGAEAQLHMDEFPPVLILLEGNGPGEPLEGEVVNAVSIVISGVPAILASGTFDGTRLELSDAAFRIRVVVGKIKQEDVSAGMPAIVDFKIEGLKVTTKEPLTDRHIVLEIRTTLVAKPSGNPLFDDFLGGAEIIVNLEGELVF